jgi:tRNA pseudouridine55 synthase
MVHTNMNGLLVLDKPPAMTSRDAVNRAQRWFPPKTKLGHTGTLDPLATGVLVLCVGSATRLAEYVQALPKTYETTLRLGARSDTDDADGTIAAVPAAVPPTVEGIRSALDSFLGEIEQLPPAYSAAKLSGERAYDRARRGEEVALTARTVCVDRIEVLGYGYPELRLRIDCGKGTYIRSIARDLGEKLGCGAYVAALQRTRVGPFTPEQAIPLDADAAMARSRLLPLHSAIAHLPRVVLDEPDVLRLRNGQSVVSARARALPPGEVAVFDRIGQLVGIAGNDARGRLRPEKILAG